MFKIKYARNVYFLKMSYVKEKNEKKEILNKYFIKNFKNILFYLYA